LHPETVLAARHSVIVADSGPAPGRLATPGYLAGRRRKVPIVVHEANCRAT